MGVAKCPTCDDCNTQSTVPKCAGYADGCYCIQKWPILGVEALAAAGVKTFVVGFGSNVDAKTLNAAADKGGTAIAGCDPSSDSPICFYKATLPSDLNAALADIVQKVVSESCTGECGIEGTRTCTASGWSECVAPPELECTGSCGAKGKQNCVHGALTACDAVCVDADAGSARAAGSGSGSASGSEASGGSGEAGSSGLGGNGEGNAAMNGVDTGDDGGCSCRTASTSFGSRGILAIGFGLLAILFRRAPSPDLSRSCRRCPFTRRGTARVGANITIPPRTLCCMLGPSFVRRTT